MDAQLAMSNKYSVVGEGVNRRDGGYYVIERSSRAKVWGPAKDRNDCIDFMWEMVREEG